MASLKPKGKSVVAAFFMFLAIIGPVWAEGSRLDRLFQDLAEAEEGTWQEIEQEIWEEWSRSGSAAMDLLLDRGREAMAEGDLIAAIEHFSALTDHAPDFAEGWNARATAYFNAGHYGPSLADIERTLVLNPRHFGALSGLGMIMEAVEDYEKAMRAYKLAIALHPHRPDLVEAIDRLEQILAGSEI